MKFIPYLVFTGSAEKAMNYYKDVFEGQILNIQRFGDMPGEKIADPIKNYVMLGKSRRRSENLFFPILPTGCRGRQVTVGLFDAQT